MKKLIILAIIGIVLAMAIPKIKAKYHDYKLGTAIHEEETCFMDNHNTLIMEIDRVRKDSYSGVICLLPAGPCMQFRNSFKEINVDIEENWHMISCTPEQKEG